MPWFRAYPPGADPYSVDDDEHVRQHRGLEGAAHDAGRDAHLDAPQFVMDTDQLTDAGRAHERHLVEVDDDLVGSGLDGLTERVAEGGHGGEIDLAPQRDDRRIGQHIGHDVELDGNIPSGLSRKHSLETTPARWAETGNRLVSRRRSWAARCRGRGRTLPPPSG